MVNALSTVLKVTMTSCLVHNDHNLTPITFIIRRPSSVESIYGRSCHRHHAEVNDTHTPEHSILGCQMFFASKEAYVKPLRDPLAARAAHMAIDYRPHPWASIDGHHLGNIGDIRMV